MPTRFPVLVFAFGLALLLAAGCASSGPSVDATYDADRNRMRYRTSDIRLSGLQLGDSYATSTGGVNLVATGRCTGQNCRPRTFTLLLLRSSSATSSDVAVYDRELVLNADDKTYRWEDPNANEDNQGVRVEEQILRVNIAAKKLRRLATADEVSGRFGGQSFRMDRGSREPLRALFARIDRPSSSSEDGSGNDTGGQMLPR